MRKNFFLQQKIHTKCEEKIWKFLIGNQPSDQKTLKLFMQIKAYVLMKHKMSKNYKEFRHLLPGFQSALDGLIDWIAFHTTYSFAMALNWSRSRLHNSQESFLISFSGFNKRSDFGWIFGVRWSFWPFLGVRTRASLGSNNFLPKNPQVYLFTTYKRLEILSNPVTYVPNKNWLSWKNTMSAGPGLINQIVSNIIIFSFFVWKKYNLKETF